MKLTIPELLIKIQADYDNLTGTFYCIDNKTNSPEELEALYGTVYANFFNIIALHTEGIKLAHKGLKDALHEKNGGV